MKETQEASKRVGWESKQERMQVRRESKQETK